MIVGRVIGNVWATRKEKSLNGLKMMIVRRIDPWSKAELETIVAVDFIGAGVGETVLVVTGSSARMSKELEHSSVDATIVGIIDAMEVKED